MTTDAQVAANRRNAQRSTGPRSPGGKARAAGNAVRHGLSTAVVASTPLPARVMQIARAILGDAIETEDALDLAKVAAEATYMVELVRAYRLEVLSGGSRRQQRSPTKTPPPLTAPMAPVADLAVSGGRNASRSTDTELDLKEQELWAVKISEAFLQHKKLLSSLDRYESRALSRQRRALSRFTALMITANSAERRAFRPA